MVAWKKVLATTTLRRMLTMGLVWSWMLVACVGVGVAGCTASEACNYNPIASCDDGSCEFSPAIDLGEDIETCDGSVVLEAGPGYDSYLWSTGESTDSIEVTVSGLYDVSVSVENPNGNVSLAFDGEGFVVFEPHVGGGLNDADFSMSAWIYPEPELSYGCDGDTTIWSSILRRDGAFNLMLYDGRLRAEVFTSSGFDFAETEFEVPLESWSFVSAVWEENELSLFIQGQEQSLLNSGQVSISSSTTSTYVGFSEFYCQGFVGLIHQVQLWGDALDESQVVQSMSHPSEIDSVELLGLFQGSSVMNGAMLDYSGLQNLGSAEGIEIVSSTPPLVSPSACYATDTISVVLNHGSCYCGDGSVWHEEIQECLPVVTSDNACQDGTVWSEQHGGCIVANPSDTDFDGCVSMTDLLDLLSVFGTCNEIPWSCGDPLEYQGYDYETVQIGEQCWFAENLQATSYANGDPLSVADNIEDWVGSLDGMYETYGNPIWGCQNLEFAPFDVCNPDSSLHYFGRLYNWYAVNDSRGLCPVGWDVPSDSAFAALEMLLDVPEDEVFSLGWRGVQAGKRLKSNSTDHYPWNGNNTTGLSLVPSGTVNSGFDTPFGGAGYDVVLWTSTSYAVSPPYAWFRSFNSTYDSIHRNAFYRHLGASVRCIKDSE